MDQIFFHMDDADMELMPAKQHPADAAYDLRAKNDMVIGPGDFKPVPTGLRLEMPAEYAAQVRPRSGLALRHGVTVLNSPGTIDAGYRGEVQVILINHGKEPFSIRRGDRIAQLLFEKLPDCELHPKASLAAGDRGEAGFGSTGVN